jgi:hypothetical protein
MKEFTIEQKAKAYDEALEKAKAAICYADPDVYYHWENRIMK